MKLKHRLLVRKLEREFYQSRIYNSNIQMKTPWHILLNLSNKKITNRNICFVYDTDKVDDPGIVARIFNEDFLNALSLLSNKIDKSIKVFNFC